MAVGSWSIFGQKLPEFGITEAIGSVLGKERTAQGGSNLYGPSPSQAAYSPNASYAPAGYDPFAQSGGSSGGTPAPSYSAPSGGNGGSNYGQQWADMGRSGTPPEGWHGESGGTNEMGNQMRSDIEGGYGSYFNSLDAMMQQLPGQKEGQEQVVQNQYTQGMAGLTGQRDVGQRELETQRTKTETSQAKNLSDLSENIRNMFTTGSVMLGQKGAGDSSAANMYSYAVSKLGSKQRGDITTKTSEIMNDINDREFKLTTAFNTEQQNLTGERDNKIIEISQWFDDAQNKVRQMQASGQLSKSQDLQAMTQNLLNSAMQELANAKTMYENRKSALQEWAMSRSENIQQLKNNMAQISGCIAQPKAFQPITGQPQWGAGGNLTAPYGYGGKEEKDRPQY